MVEYRSIAVPFSLDANVHNHAEVARTLAIKFNAWQLGLAAGEVSLLFFADGPAAADLVRMERDGLLEKISDAERVFRATNKDRGDQLEFRGGQGLPTHFSLSALSAVDLVVMQRPQAFQNALLGPNPGDLLMQAGRPVLVVSADDAGFKTKKVAIAWKDTREARRAVSDALPLLKAARSVSIISVPEGHSGAAVESTADVMGWLSHHGISASVLQPKSVGRAPEQIEELARDAGVDLIVAGAYGRSRFSEWLFGGVTTHLLESSSLPVLFSH